MSCTSPHGRACWYSAAGNRRCRKNFERFLVHSVLWQDQALIELIHQASHQPHSSAMLVIQGPSACTMARRSVPLARLRGRGHRRLRRGPQHGRRPQRARRPQHHAPAQHEDRGRERQQHERRRARQHRQAVNMRSRVDKQGGGDAGTARRAKWSCCSAFGSFWEARSLHGLAMHTRYGLLQGFRGLGRM